MATLDWQLRRTGEVTLVELSVRSDRDQRVRIESRLDPVWPPRQQGVPARGWTGNSFEGTVERGEPLVVGYATPAPPEEPPAEITETGRPTEDEAVTPRTLVRALGDARPPRDAVHGPGPSGGTAAADATATSDEPTAPHEGTDAKTGNRMADTWSPTRGHGRRESGRATRQSAEPAVWFEAVESRLATAEMLAAATDADEIRAAVDTVGGIEAVRALQAQLDADRRQLRSVRGRSESLADQLSAVELPLATLERVV